jgi:hypothetical protein
MTLGEAQKKLRQLRKAETDAAKTAEKVIDAAKANSASMVERKSRASKSAAAARTAKAVGLSTMEHIWMTRMNELYGMTPPLDQKQLYQLRWILLKWVDAGLRPDLLLDALVRHWPLFVENVVSMKNPEWISHVPHIGFLLIHRDIAITMATPQGYTGFLIQQ